MVKRIILLAGFIWMMLVGCDIVPKEVDLEQLHLSEEAREIREAILRKAEPDGNYEIQTEVLLGNVIVSGTTNEEWMGFHFFEVTPEYKYMDMYAGVKAKDHFSYEYRNELGEIYGLYWRLDPNTVSTEITYCIEGNSPVTLEFSTEEMFVWKKPYADCTYWGKDFDANGNEIEGSYFDSEHINQRILLDKTMYWNTGVKCDPVPDKEISGTVESTVFINDIPTKHGQSNFGKGHPYKIEDDCLKVRVFEQWYIFEKLWEVDTIASEIRTGGMTLVCSHGGSGIATNFHMNGQYWIEKKIDSGWEEVLPIKDTWIDKGYFIDQNGSVEIDVNWENYYREFESGTYRLKKDLIWFEPRNTEYINIPCYFEFEVE